jgi:hypothetical protein
MRRTMPIRALVFPVVTGENGGSRIVRISRGEAYRRFMPGLRQAKKMSQVQRHAHHDALLPLIDLPAFRIELGSDVTAIPAGLAQVSGMTE